MTWYDWECEWFDLTVDCDGDTVWRCDTIRHAIAFISRLLLMLAEAWHLKELNMLLHSNLYLDVFDEFDCAMMWHARKIYGKREIQKWKLKVKNQNWTLWCVQILHNSSQDSSNMCQGQKPTANMVQVSVSSQSDNWFQYMFDRTEYVSYLGRGLFTQPIFSQPLKRNEWSNWRSHWVIGFF